MSLGGPSSGCLREKDRRRVVMRLDHLQRIPKRAQAWKDWGVKKALCLDSPLDSGRPCAYFNEGRQIFEKVRVVHPGARGLAEGSKANEFI